MASKTLLSCLVLAAGATPIPAQVRDSAGVLIATSAAPRFAGAAAWRLSPRPVLDIGGGAPDSPQDMAGSLPMVALENGRIAVLYAGNTSIRYYDAAGKMLGSVGRRGEGPGEFRNVVLFRGRGDTLMVYDGSNRRLTWLDSRMKVARTQSVSLEVPSVGHAMGMFAEPFTMFGDGSLGVRSWPLMSRAPTATRYRDSVLVLRVVPGSETNLRSLIRSAGTEMVQTPSNPRQGRRVVHGASTEIAARGDQIYVTRNDRWEVEEYDREGRLRRLIRIPMSPRPITQAFITEEIKTYVPLGRLPPALQKAEEEWLRRPEYAATFPPIENLFVSTDGLLYVIEREHPKEPRTLAIFGGDGLLLSRLPLPEGLTVRAVGRDMLYGRTEDADGIIHLVGYAILRP